MVFDGNDKSQEKTTVLIFRMIFLDLICGPSLDRIHANLWHKLVPSHATNKRSLLLLSISQNDQWDVKCRQELSFESGLQVRYVAYAIL